MKPLFIAKPVEEESISIGKFSVALVYGKEEHRGLWISDSETGEGVLISGPDMENAVRNLWNEHF